MNILNKVSSFIDNINIKIGKLFSWLLLLMVLLTCLIVILRYLFNIGFIWMQELVRYLYAAVFMLCAAYTLAKDEHVRVDIFYSKLKDGHKIIINVIGSLLFLIPVCLCILYYSFTYVINSWVQLEGSLEERGLHAVYLLKTLIWAFAIMLILQSVYVISQGSLKLFRKYYQ